MKELNVTAVDLAKNVFQVCGMTAEQQDIQCLHRLRERYMAQCTRLSNQARGLLSEFGLVAPQGQRNSLPADKTGTLCLQEGERPYMSRTLK